MDVLANEHGLIRQYLDNLALAVRKMEDEARPPAEFFEKAIDFARNFADTFHHYKEEHVMFARLAQIKGGEFDGEIDSLRHQHEQGRKYIAEMKIALEGYVENDPIATSQLIENTAAYIAMLRNHIHREDHVYFPMAAEELSDEEYAQLKVEFDRAAEKVGDGAFEEYHKLVIDMGSMLTHL
jgi:hemerythrin-like domain-containing protein